MCSVTYNYQHEEDKRNRIEVDDVLQLVFAIPSLFIYISFFI